MRSCNCRGLLRNFDHVRFVSHLWVVTLRPVSRLTLAGPHSGMSAEPSVNSIPKFLMFSLVTGMDSIMYSGWSSSTTQSTFRRPDCAAWLAESLKEARAAVPPTPNKNVLLLILRFIDSPSPCYPARATEANGSTIFPIPRTPLERGGGRNGDQTCRLCLLKQPKYGGREA